MFALFDFFLATNFFAFSQADEVGRLNRHRNQDGREKKKGGNFFHDAIY
jgi:hypothetical protein